MLKCKYYRQQVVSSYHHHNISNTFKVFSPGRDKNYVGKKEILEDLQ